MCVVFNVMTCVTSHVSSLISLVLKSVSQVPAEHVWPLVYTTPLTGPAETTLRTNHCLGLVPIVTLG